MSDIYQFNVGGTTYNLANLGLLAPVQITLTADRLYNTGDQFIYTGLLYEATETIAQGTSITIGSNAQLADCVTKQISEINSNLSANNLGTSIDISSYTTEGNKYTFPSNGYVYLNGSTLSAGHVYARIDGSNGQNVFYLNMNITEQFQTNAIFVKKGMKCIITEITSGATANFIPLA